MKSKALDFQHFYREFIPGFRKDYSGRITAKAPYFLYEPLHYVLEHAGKQLRPAILAASADAFGNADPGFSFPAGACIEMIHNFTLIHDDIMDNDMLRHGAETLHAKWDKNRAILAGDGLFAIALSELDYYKNHTALYAKMLPLILNSVIRVCEGQALDMEFEQRNDVDTEAYLEMVTKKTAWLLAVSARIGAMIGGASDDDAEKVEEILLHIGILFQIQDDLLELTSNPETMGKTLGSDLVRGKKTYPYLYAKQELSPPEWEEFMDLCSEERLQKYGMKAVRDFLGSHFIFDKIQEVIKLYYDNICKQITGLPSEVQELYRTMLKFVMYRDK